MTALWMTVVLMTAARPASGALQVVVIAPGDVSDSLVEGTCAEANAIWQPEGVALECQRIRAAQESAGRPLTVSIDEQEARGEPDNALGWIVFTPSGPGRLIHLSRAQAEEVVRQSPGHPDVTVRSHELLVGRALGRALAHEMGHYLLRSKAHTPRGLMRATRPGAEFVDLYRYGFELTPDQSSAVARFLAGDEARIE